MEPPPRLRTFAEALARARALRRGAEVTIRLRPVAERDRTLRKQLETTHVATPDRSVFGRPDMPAEIDHTAEAGPSGAGGTLDPR